MVADPRVTIDPVLANRISNKLANRSKLQQNIADAIARYIRIANTGSTVRVQEQPVFKVVRQSQCASFVRIQDARFPNGNARATLKIIEQKWRWVS